MSTDDPIKKIAEAVAGAAPVSDGDPFEDEEFDGVAPADDASVDWGLVRRCASEPQNDIGNARRLLHRHGRDLLHIQRVGWHAWDGRRFVEDLDDQISRRFAHETAEMILYESYVIDPTEHEQARIDAGEAAERAIGNAEKGERQALQRAIEKAEVAKKAVQSRRANRLRFANSSGNKGKLDGMLAELLPMRSRAMADMNRDAFAFNVQNGTLRFYETEEEDLECPDPEVKRMKTVWKVRLDPHRREDQITKLAEVEWDPNARPAAFLEFIRRIQPKREIRAYLRRLFGYGILGTSREQMFAIFHGEGANGKSTLVDIICRIMGDYSTTLPIASLVGDASRRGAEATPDLARLPDARFVRASEPKENMPLNEDVIKLMTSGEPIPVRRLNKEFFDVLPVFTLVISANRKPDIRGDNDGIWRRVHLVPFDVQIPVEERDKDLGAKLWDERSGILAWLVAGALDYLNSKGLQPPAEVNEATQEYRDDSDVISAFIRGALEVTHSPHDSCLPGELSQAFQVYCQQEALTPWKDSTFNRRFAQAAAKHGIDRAKSSTTVYRGVRVREAFRQPPSRTHVGDPGR
jgi:putative DNA primase/helicase